MTTHLKQDQDSNVTICGSTRWGSVLHALYLRDVECRFVSFDAGKGERLEGVTVSPAGEPHVSLPNICRRCAAKAVKV